MSHFYVLVVGPDPAEQLAPYDENLELPMHQIYSKQEIIEKERQWIADYKKNYYDKYIADPKKYEFECSNKKHIEYVRDEFPKMLEWTDEECYEDYIKDYREDIEGGETWCEIHEDGSLWKTTNQQNAKWDWWVIGGRWRGELQLKEGAEPMSELYEDPFVFKNDKAAYNAWTKKCKEERRCDQAYLKDVINLEEAIPFALVKFGYWYEKGEMGWWGTSSNDKEQNVWKKEVLDLLKDVPGDTLLTVVDCHI